VLQTVQSHILRRSQQASFPPWCLPGLLYTTKFNGRLSPCGDPVLAGQGQPQPLVQTDRQPAIAMAQK